MSNQEGARSALVLGGGLSGLAAAWTLARSGIPEVTVVERGSRLGGLAGSFERGGHFYPLGYHHILHLDSTLAFFLNEIGAEPDVRWRAIRMYFRTGGRNYDFANPIDLLRFPLSLPDKVRFAWLMLRAFAKPDWSDWMGRSGQELIGSWGGDGVREAIFEPLAQLKFELPTSEVSAAWLGARLHFREGSAATRLHPRHELDHHALRRGHAPGRGGGRPNPDGDDGGERRGPRRPPPRGDALQWRTGRSRPLRDDASHARLPRDGAGGTDSEPATDPLHGAALRDLCDEGSGGTATSTG